MIENDGKALGHFPDGWVQYNLEKIATKITKGATPTTYGFTFLNDGIKFIKVENIRNNSIDIKGIKHFISEEAHGYQKRSILEENDILFSIAGTIGNTCIIKKEHLPANTNQALAIIGGYLDLVVPKLLKLQLASFITDSTKAKARGGAMNNISLGDLKNLEIIIPPLPEQHKIVAKIEELFSELDNGIENLKKVREQLKTYRQAVLKYAFEGKLTKQWRTLQRRAGTQSEPAEKLLEQIKTEREKHYQKQLEDWKKACEQAKTKGNKKPARPRKPKELPPLTEKELAELPELPKGWGWVKLGEISKKITDGEHFRPKTMANGIYFLSAKDVRDNGISFDDPLYISEKDAQKARLRCNPEKGDILIVSRGATVGRLCTVNTDNIFCLLGSVILIKVCDRIGSNYLSYIMKSSIIQKYLLGLCGSTAQQAIYLRDIINIPIPVLSQHEQHQIAQEIEFRLSVCDKIEQTIEDSLKKAEALRQSILKKAFAGELTRDWREKHPELISGENSAEKLLERIKAEKALSAADRKKPQSKRTKKSSPKQKYYATKEKK